MFFQLDKIKAYGITRSLELITFGKSFETYILIQRDIIICAEALDLSVTSLLPVH